MIFTRIFDPKTNETLIDLKNIVKLTNEQLLILIKELSAEYNDRKINHKYNYEKK